MSAVLAEKLNAQPKPFLKWVGGKRQLLPELLERVPRGFDTYFEPFLGGGALFFSLLPEKAVLSDTNERLVRTYRAVRDDVDELIAELATYPHDRVFFEELRRVDVDALDDTPRRAISRRTDRRISAVTAAARRVYGGFTADLRRIRGGFGAGFCGFRPP